jgi:hypothetical protein
MSVCHERRNFSMDVAIVVAVLVGRGWRVLFALAHTGFEPVLPP